MSRIRSIHPGIWTDEEFVGLSSFARLLFIGIWNECDDKGIFVWSALQLKMRLLPADNIDAAELLCELEQADCIKKYEVAGKNYGAVRNFAKFQRPKKPNNIHPTTPQILNYAGHDGPAIPVDDDEVTDQLPTSGVKSPQMEDEGGRRELVKESSDSSTKRAEPFKRPDYADPELWSDFLKNRKAKRLPNTATAFAKMNADMAKWCAETGWPPNEVLRACVAKGWGGIYDPREKNDDRNGNKQSGSGMGSTERAARQALHELSGGEGRFDEGGAGLQAGDIGAGYRTIDALPDTMRAIGHVQ